MNKKKEILIGSTCFLLPKYKTWEKIKKIYKINFSTYNNLNFVLENKKKNQTKILIIFLEDLIQSDKNIRIKLEFILTNIKKSLISNDDLIVCYSDYFSTEIIRNSKFQNKLFEINNYFKKKIYSLCKSYNNLSFIDLDIEFKKIGYDKVLDKRNWYLAHCRVSESGLDIIIEQIRKLLFSISNPASKVLVLDCDNTIWGGVVGDEGTFGIKIGGDGEGLIFQDFQKEIIELKNKGIILTVASKNNYLDVKNVFKKNDQMKLKLNDISIFKVNWREKYLNIKEMSQELNLGLSSFVFWDDNPIEREKIKTYLPDVKVINAPKDTYHWIDLIRNLELFAKPLISREDKKKTQQYKSIAKFNEDKKNKKDDDFLKKILIKPKIFIPKKNNILRFSQMTLKTNQFNLRTIRMTEIDVKNLINQKNEFSFMCEVKDIYGDHGIIGLAIIKKINNDIFYLKNFLLSCRILGRKIEYWFFEKILQDLQKKKGKSLIVGFLPTEKNHVAKLFLDSLSLKKINNLKINSIIKPLKKEKLFIKEITNFNFKANKYYG
jgi:FkbH-like protein